MRGLGAVLDHQAGAPAAVQRGAIRSLFGAPTRFKLFFVIVKPFNLSGVLCRINRVSETNVFRECLTAEF